MSQFWHTLREYCFFEVNSIVEKEATWLLNIMQAKTYSFVRALVAPDEPKNKTVEQLTQVFKQTIL